MDWRGMSKRYKTDQTFQTRVALYATLMVNLLFVTSNAILGILSRSVWYNILAIYYGVLAVMRFLLARFLRQNEIGEALALEYARARVCGVFLMILNLTLSGAILMILYQDKSYRYNGIFIYAMAIYAFYAVVHTIVRLVKERNCHSPVLLMSKSISLIAALVSMLALETAMFAQFGEDTLPKFKWFVIAATGAVVCASIVTISVYTIVKSTREIKRLRGGDPPKEEP